MKIGARTKRILFIVAAALFTTGAIVAAVQIVRIQTGYSAASNEYSALREQYAPDAQSNSVAAGKQSADDEAASNAPSTDLANINPDYVGWLSISGTDIDYPVVCGTDNAHYLNTTFEGNGNAVGTIFMDYRNTDGFSSRHTILYGHNMKDGTMFGGLHHYLDSDYLATNDILTIAEPDGTAIQYRIFAAYETDMYDVAYRLDFTSDSDFAAFLQTLAAPEGAAQILTLSTCTSGGDDAERILMHAVYEE